MNLNYVDFVEDLENNFKQDEKNNKEIITKIDGYKSIIESEKENHERFVSLEGETKALNNKKVELSAELKRLDELEKEKNTLIQDIDQYNNDLETFYNDAKTVLSEFEEEINPIKTNDDLNSLESLVENLRTNLKNEINEIEAANTLGIIPNGIIVKLKNSNELRFIVNNRNTVIEFLKSKME